MGKGAIVVRPKWNPRGPVGSLLLRSWRSWIVSWLEEQRAGLRLCEGEKLSCAESFVLLEVVSAR